MLLAILTVTQSLKTISDEAQMPAWAVADLLWILVTECC